MTHRTLFCRLGAAVAALVLAGPALAQEPPPPGPEWAELTRVDVEAAWRLQQENHPGAHPALGDADFRQRLERGHALALERAARVTDVGGHRAVLNGFAAGLGDGHIVFSPEVAVPYRWAGLVMGKQGPDWRVAVHEPAEGQPDLAGARLLGCDDQTADELARERLGGFRIDWEVEAQRVARAPFLLLDDGNPFLESPAVCRFESSTGVVELQMDWRPIPLEALREAIARAPRGARAGMGVRPFAGGYWISLQSLGEGAQAMVDEVRAQADAMRAAPAVVLDMRGNGGGASVFGQQIAQILVGEAHFAARGAGSGPCDSAWRVSPGNLEGIRSWRAIAEERGPEFSRWLEASIAAMERALAAGEAFDKPIPTCPVTAPTPADEVPPPLMQGRLVLLTDGACFSSCMLVADNFRQLGALHLGHATDRVTRYMEVRHAPLPSGFGEFSTMQKVAVGDAVTGPFDPDLVYPGLMSDDAELEAWVIDQLAVENRGP